MSDATSGRASAWATRDGAEEDTGVGSTGTVGGLAIRSAGSVGVLDMGDDGVQAGDKSVGRV